jgi:hypothetical protein
MDAEFSKDAPARNFDSWPWAERREIYAECRKSGCCWTFSPQGHVVRVDD